MFLSVLAAIVVWGAILQGEPLIGAAVYIPALDRAVHSNSDGYFTIQGACGETTTVVIQYIGFQSDTISLTIKENTFLDVALEVYSLETITVKANRIAEVPGKVSIPVSKLKDMPMLLGESDLFRSLQRLPGISNAIEGTTGLVVRGGSIDQNLILLDGATIYNNGHIFGFVSAINPAIVKQVDVYSGYIPGKFGGRLSSVVDIHTKSGSNTEKKREVSFGTINSSWTLEGPFGKKQQNSFMVSGRLSHSGLLTLGTLPSYLRAKNALLFAGMYDVNTKLTWHGQHHDILSFSLYSGDDFWGARAREENVSNTSILKWGNKTASLRYVRPMKNNWINTTLFTYNIYGNELRSSVKGQDEIEGQVNAFSSKGSIREIKLSHCYGKLLAHQQEVKLGIDLMRKSFTPASVLIQNNQSEILNLNPVIPVYDGGLFIDHILPIGTNLILYSDLRFSVYRQENFKKNWVSPRLSLSYQIGSNWKVYTGYSHMIQPLHLITFNGSFYPYEYWLPATVNYEPEQSQIYNLGCRYEKRNWFFSIEGFYKKMNALVTLESNRSLTEVFGAGDWTGFLIGNGDGKAYGVEVLLKKNIGRLNGYLGYTWSRSWRQFDPVNDGDWTPFVYDRPHDLEIVLNYRCSNRLSAHVGFVYQRGQPFTSPTAYIRGFDGNSRAVYTRLFNDRLPDFHRTDIMIDYEYRTMKKKQKNAKISIGMYNVYGRINPMVVTFSGITKRDGLINFFARRQGLFRFVPSLNYSLKW